MTTTLRGILGSWAAPKYCLAKEIAHSLYKYSTNQVSEDDIDLVLDGEIPKRTKIMNSACCEAFYRLAAIPPSEYLQSELIPYAFLVAYKQKYLNQQGGDEEFDCIYLLTILHKIALAGGEGICMSVLKWIFTDY